MWRGACALALLFAAFARTSSYKRAEMSSAPFVLGSRYGRSPPRMISPRNDRFFMGSRYGKRSEAPQHPTLRALSNLPDMMRRDIMSICELAAFAPLCSRMRYHPTSLYNRIDQRTMDRTRYEN